jgi:hypothetical protein
MVGFVVWTVDASDQSESSVHSDAGASISALYSMPMLVAIAALLATTAPRVEVVVPASIHAEPITGRAFVVFSHDSTPEPRLPAGGMVSVPFFGQDVDQLAPGTPGVIDERSQGYPLQSMASLRPGDYYAQAIVSVYTRFARTRTIPSSPKQRTPQSRYDVRRIYVRERH